MESSVYDEPELATLENDSDHPRPAGVVISRGVEGRITYKGNLSDVLQQLLGGLAVGMSYAGCRTISELHQKSRFVQVTQAGLRESHPHDIQITRESPNYNMV
jgi:IMP dehydrogenase